MIIKVQPLVGGRLAVNRENRRAFGVFSALPLFISLLLAFPVFCHAYDDSKFSDQRQRYRLALNQLASGHLTAFNNSLKRLENYALYPYLEYQQINRKMNRLPKREVRQFIEKYANTAVGNKMTSRWLNQLIRKHQWQQYVDDWDPSIRNTRLRCWYLRAKYRIGQKTEALNAVQPLWLRATSQPKACDPLFKEWIDEGYLTQDLAWQRLTLAVEARRNRLASYIVRKLLKDDYARLGAEYLAIHRKPRILVNEKRVAQALNGQQDKARQIITHGIKRLARKDIGSAMRLWEVYSSRFAFSERQIISVNLALSVAGATLPDVKADELDRVSVANETPAAIEQQIRTALHEADWPKITFLIQSLPDADQNRPRWRYWLARSLEAQQLVLQDSPSPRHIYQELSKDRSYYGFLAADLLDVEYAMEDQPAPVSPEMTRELGNNKAVVRALELFAVNQINDARREWHMASRNFDAPLLTAAGKLAEAFGWHEKAIQSYIQAQYWDDLQPRFPLAYKNEMMDASRTQNIESSWLFAIARQESAFSPDAKSRAGALGLMQLMPRTAKQTAEQIGLKFKKSDLLKPDTNIHLGSNYLKGLLDQFDGNRILATTAYNAGPHRVKRWLDRSNKNLSFDAWIETIPFKETRAYVKNVLAFSVIYDYRMDQNGQLVSSSEADQML